MASSLHMIHIGEGCNFLERRNASAADDGHTQVINQLLADQGFGIPNRVENFSHCQRRCGVLANDAKALLQLRRYCVLQPEKMIWLQFFSQTSSLDRSEPVVRVMQ